MRAFDPTRVPLCLASPWSDSPLPTDLELGAGSGLHAIRRAQLHPDRRLIAIERTTKAKRMQRRHSHHAELMNLITLRADAIHWVCHQVPLEAIENCYLLYPNPYPKGRQRNLRWHNMPFMGFLLTRLKAHGRLIMASNSWPYISEAKDTMTQTWGMDLEEERLLEKSEIPRTHFEKKYLSRGHSCWNLIFTKRVSL